MAILHKALGDAVEDDLIARNPCPRLDPTRPATEADPFTRAEVKLLLAEIEQRRRGFYQVWFLTGMRSSEIVALRWDDVDWNAEALTIRRGRSPRMGGVEATPKPVSAPSGREPLSSKCCARNSVTLSEPVAASTSSQTTAVSPWTRRRCIPTSSSRLFGRLSTPSWLLRDPRHLRLTRTRRRR